MYVYVSMQWSMSREEETEQRAKILKLGASDSAIPSTTSSAISDERHTTARLCCIVTEDKSIACSGYWSDLLAALPQAASIG